MIKSQIVLQTNTGFHLYNPNVPISASNPSLLALNPSYTYQGCAVYNGANSGVLVNNRMFSLNTTNNKLAYLQGSSWVTTNFSFPFGSVNMGAGGGFLFVKPDNSNLGVYRFNGSSQPTMLTLTNLPFGIQNVHYSANDIIVDNEGNFYLSRIDYSNNTVTFLDVFNPNGVYQYSFTVVNGISLVSGVSFYQGQIYWFHGSERVMKKGTIVGTEIICSHFETDNLITWDASQSSSFAPIKNGNFLISHKTEVNSINSCGPHGTIFGFYDEPSNIMPFQGPYIYSWQFKQNPGNLFQNITGGTSATYSPQNDGYYRLKITSVSNNALIGYSNTIYFKMLQPLPTPQIISTPSIPILTSANPSVSLNNIVNTPLGAGVYWYKEPQIYSYFPTGNTLSVSTPGNYYARFYYLVKQDCYSEKSNKILVYNPFLISQQENEINEMSNENILLEGKTERDEFSVFPNPVFEELKIQVSVEEFDLTIKDALGIEKIHLEKTKQKTLNISSLKSGAYQIVLFYNDEYHFKSFVKY